MFSLLNGKIKSVYKDYVVLDINGLGFKIFTSRCSSFLLEENYLFYVYDVYKEPIIDIYGFLNEDELNMFKNLITVNGIGGKTALVILNALSVDQIVYFIKNKDYQSISSIQGVASKGIRIINELFNKIKDYKTTNFFEYEGVYKALLKIGYDKKLIANALNKLPFGLDDNSALKIAIKEINNDK